MNGRVYFPQRPRTPTHSPRRAIEAAIYVAVVATSLAILMPGVGAAIGKARLTGMLTLVRAPMLDVMERLALTGELKETELVERQPPVSAEERRRRRAEVLAYKDRPDPAASRDRTSGDAMQADGGAQRPAQADFLRNAFQTQLEQQAERETAREMFRFQVIGSSIVTYGSGANLPSFFVTFSPATTVDHAPATIIWLCGSRTAPTGWKVPGGITPTNLPPELLHSVCRGQVQPD